MLVACSMLNVNVILGLRVKNAKDFTRQARNVQRLGSRFMTALD